MKMIMVTQCCCGCTVRTGSLIIGILCAISSLFDFTYGLTLFVALAGSADESQDATHIMSKGETVALAVLSIVIFAACVLLIYGILKERLMFIAAWIIAFIVYLAIVAVFILQVAIAVLVDTERVRLLWDIPALLIAFATYLYCIVVVNSHYRNLKDGVTLPPPPPLIITV